MATLPQLALRRAASVVKIPGLKGSQMNSPARVLARQAKVRGSKVAIVFEDRQYTYAEFNRQATRYAKAALALGLRKGDVAAILMENRPEFLFIAYGLNRLGVTAALINTNLNGKSLAHVLGGEMKALFIGAECLGHLDTMEGGGPISNSKILVERSEQPDAPLAPEMRDLVALADETSPGIFQGVPIDQGILDDWACYIYTSGTTGLPKAGRSPNARWFGAGYGLGGAALGCGPFDTVYVCLPLYHASAFMLGCSFAFLHGGTMALTRKFSASRFWDDVRKYEATVFLYIGELCRYLVAQPPKADDKLHKIRAMTGNGMRAEVWRQFNERFGIQKVYEFYAATEGNCNMINLDGTIGAVGRKFWLTKSILNTIVVKFDQINEVPIRDARGFCIECDPGEAGELLGKIDPSKVTSRFDGYADPVATEKKILRNVLEKGDAYFRTGDLIRQDQKGYYYFVDRIGDTFRWKGENVSTNEVADILTQHPQVEVANVYGVTVADADGRAGMASINTKGNTEPDWKSIFEYVQSELPEYAQPLFLRWQKEAEMTGTFKLRKVELQKEGFDPSRIDEPLFFRDTQAQTYVPLTAELFDKIMGNAVRI